MKSNKRLANRKQKKQARENTDSDTVMMPMTMTGRMIATCSVMKLPYSEWNRRMLFCAGVSSARNCRTELLSWLELGSYDWGWG